MKILIIDCTLDQDSWGAHDFRRILSHVPGLEITVRRAPESDLPGHKDLFDRIIITGSRTSCFDDSSWVEGLLDYLKIQIDRHIPVLGVCFGFQMISRLYGGKKVLSESKTPEYGWIEIEIVSPHPLFKGLPKKFYTAASHREEVVEIPPEFRNSAKSKNCSIQAIENLTQPIFGIQFHPEKISAGAKKSNRLYNPKIGELILSNFIQYEIP